MSFPDPPILPNHVPNTPKSPFVNPSDMLRDISASSKLSSGWERLVADAKPRNKIFTNRMILIYLGKLCKRGESPGMGC